MGNKTHELKIWPRYFEPVKSGEKTFEMRKKDRDFKVGDNLWLREYHPQYGYTGRELLVRVTYILDGEFELPDMCVMSIVPEA